MWKASNQASFHSRIERKSLLNVRSNQTCIQSRNFSSKSFKKSIFFGFSSSSSNLRFNSSSSSSIPEKKSLSHPIEQGYDPKIVEKGWYEWWMKKGFFDSAITAKNRGRPSFSIALPPPNTTGTLHVGHALTNSLQDILIRWKRMQGSNVLWQPGMDHAGIATQVVVEKKLMKESKLTRHDLGREKFLEKVWEWKANSGGTISKQMVCFFLLFCFPPTSSIHLFIFISFKLSISRKHSAVPSTGAATFSQWTRIIIKP